MKWFRHISDSLDDPKMFKIMNKYKHKGYTTFFGMCEIYARELKNLDTFVTLSRHFCARKVSLSCNKFEEIIKFISKISGWHLELDGDILRLRIPKMKELADDYEKRKIRTLSKHSQKNHTLDIDTDIDTEEEEDKEGKQPPVDNFKKGGEKGKLEPSKNSYLIALYKSQNRSLLTAYPNHLKKFVHALEMAVGDGWSRPEVEQRLYEVAGKDIPPWEIFKRKEGDINWKKLLSESN